MREYNIHRLFEASVTLKGFHALLELATGVATLAVGPVRVSNFFFALAQREWLGGAHIWVVNFLVRLADASLRGGQEFAYQVEPVAAWPQVHIVETCRMR